MLRDVVLCWFCQLLWVRPWDAISGSDLPAWFKQNHVRFYRENINMVEKEMDSETILFCSCAMADKILSSKTAEQRFICSTAGLKHSQTSWYALAALTWQNYTWDFNTCACPCLYLFFPDANLQWKVMVKGRGIVVPFCNLGPLGAGLLIYTV